MGTSPKAERQMQGSDLRDEPMSRRNLVRPIRMLQPGDPKLDALLQAEIGRTLRNYYAELLSDPVPQRFAELLIRLDRKH